MDLESAPYGGMNFPDHHLTINSSKGRNECSTPLELPLGVSHWYWLGRKDVHCAITKGMVHNIKTAHFGDVCRGNCVPNFQSMNMCLRARPP
jgi:hypothetical protein